MQHPLQWTAASTFFDKNLVKKWTSGHPPKVGAASTFPKKVDAAFTFSVRTSTTSTEWMRHPLGYIPHCGASFKDSNNKESMRYHAYFIPEGYKLPDGVHVVTGDDPVYNESDAEEESEDDDMSVDI